MGCILPAVHQHLELQSNTGVPGIAGVTIAGRGVTVEVGTSAKGQY